MPQKQAAYKLFFALEKLTSTLFIRAYTKIKSLQNHFQQYSKLQNPFPLFLFVKFLQLGLNIFAQNLLFLLSWDFISVCQYLADSNLSIFCIIMELISGLPDDIARECMIRVSYQQFPAVALVSKRWKTEIETPEFHRQRKSTGHSQKIVVMVQARVDSEKTDVGFIKNPMNPVYRLSVLEPESGDWTELPQAPGLASGLPMFCQLARVGYDLVLMGGWDPDSWKPSRSVFVYNFMSAKWRRGADMPGGPRTFFGCASDSDRMVYIAGGHDEEKNALRSAFAYDVARDEWVQVPDMARERDECKCIFLGGKFHVIGGYSTEMQGRFERSAEAFDVATWRWDQVAENFLESAMCPRTCMDGDDERIFICRDGDVVVMQESTWQMTTKVPGEIRNVAYVGRWEEKILLIGSSGYGEPHMGFVLDCRNNKWTKLESPQSYTGHVQSACYLEI